MELLPRRDGDDYPPKEVSHHVDEQPDSSHRQETGESVVEEHDVQSRDLDISTSGTEMDAQVDSSWTPENFPVEASPSAVNLEPDEDIRSSQADQLHEHLEPTASSAGDSIADDVPADVNGASVESAAFKSWTEVSPEKDNPPYKIGPFVLLLIDEFCRFYGLGDTSARFQHELHAFGVALPDTDLWFDMYSQCKNILGNKKHTHPLAAATTIERLIEFCVSPAARRAVFSLDMVAAHSPMHVCASPKRVSSSLNSSYSLMSAHQQIQSPIVRPSQRPSSIVKPETGEEPPLNVTSTEERNNTDNGPTSRPSPTKQLVSVSKKKKKRKMKQLRSQSLVSVVSHATNQPIPAGTYGEPILVEAHRTDLRRDLTTTRLLERELRHLRIEKISTEPIVPLQKRLGFHTLTSEEERTREKLQDPYANELIMEKYGFSRRQDCALCQFPFLQYNLPHRVSFRCIMDVYDHWRYVPPDRDTASKYKPPLCYDAVQVCRMCAQLVFQHAKQPELLRPLSRKHRKAKSLASLHQATARNDEDDRGGFCSDPYALPPLLGDDVYDHRDALHHVTFGRRGRLEPVEGEGRVGVLSEFPAKAIIYSQQLDGSPFMSAKEWEVISPEKSQTRHRIEATLARVQAKPS